jgi:hypothetical protein
MPMREADGPSGGYGVRPANPDGRVFQTGGQVPPSTRPPRLPRYVSSNVRRATFRGRFARRGR